LTEAWREKAPMNPATEEKRQNLEDQRFDERSLDEQIFQSDDRF
jgi:hypothetical protein